LATFELVGTLKFQFAALLTRLVVAAIDHCSLADEGQRLCRLRGLPGSETSAVSWSLVLELLLDACELHELLGKLVSIQRIERILVLQLRGQQRQEGLEVPSQRRARSVEVRLAPGGVFGRKAVGVVPDTTCGATPDAVVMSVS